MLCRSSGNGIPTWGRSRPSQRKCPALPPPTQVLTYNTFDGFQIAHLSRGSRCGLPCVCWSPALRLLVPCAAATERLSADEGHSRHVRASCAPATTCVERFTGDLSGSAKAAKSSTARRPRTRTTGGFSRQQAEGEGFEPSIRLTTDNGFRDRRIRPLCHPSDRATGYLVPVAAVSRGCGRSRPRGEARGPGATNARGAPRTRHPAGTAPCPPAPPR